MRLSFNKITFKDGLHCQTKFKQKRREKAYIFIKGNLEATDEHGQRRQRYLIVL